MGWQGRWLLFFGAWLMAALGALPYAGSWNDGSRLAAVESLVDRHSLAIDDSIFVRPDLAAKDTLPYHPGRDILLRHGTKDKLFIDGHFYSDKPPVISFLMAVLYQVYQWLGGPRAAFRPDLFCWFITACTSGLAFALAVYWMERLGRRAGLSGRWLAVWLGSFALATVAVTYTRHVNNHIILLAVIVGLLWHVLQLADEHVHSLVPGVSRGCTRLVCIGMLAGLGYNLDLGSGPVLIACLTPLILFRARSLAGLGVYLLALAPWLIAHHALNYALGGTFKPVNSNPEYSTWPGCPFDPSNMTGFLRHSPGQFGVYFLALLFGKHGFIGHNMPLFMTLPALVLVWRQRCSARTPEGWFAAAWTAGTFLMYAAFSNNYGGACCSIRWFVPLLAPAYWLLAWLMTQRADARHDFVVLSAWGIVLSAIMWVHGPWITHLVPAYWAIQAAALTCWLLPAIWRYYRSAAQAGDALASAAGCSESKKAA